MAGQLFRHLGQISEWLGARTAQAVAAVDRIPVARVDRDPVEELVEEVVSEYSLEVLRLTGQRRMPEGVTETRVDVRGDPRRAILDSSRPVLISGHRIEIRERFEGNPDLLLCRPSRYDANPPRGDIHGNEVVVTIERPADAVDPGQVKAEVDSAFAKIAQYLDWTATDVHGFNAGLAAAVRAAVQARRQHLETARGLEDVLGIPIERRPDASPALTIDIPRRRAAAVERTADDREVFLKDEAYQDLVTFLGSIRRLIERLPRTFSPMPEEALRDILLLILNNQFGTGTGESFSRKGKTDIMIQQAAGPVFIAECKKWHGPKKFREAIDQLLGYLVWRDTKAAIVNFATGRDITKITADALSELRQHPQFVRDAPPVGDDPVVVLHHEGDRQRLVRVALIVVPVPPD